MWGGVVCDGFVRVMCCVGFESVMVVCVCNVSGLWGVQVTVMCVRWKMRSL